MNETSTFISRSNTFFCPLGWPCLAVVQRVHCACLFVRNVISRLCGVAQSDTTSSESLESAGLTTARSIAWDFVFLHSPPPGSLKPPTLAGRHSTLRSTQGAFTSLRPPPIPLLPPMTGLRACPSDTSGPDNSNSGGLHLRGGWQGGSSRTRAFLKDPTSGWGGGFQPRQQLVASQRLFFPAPSPIKLPIKIPAFLPTEQKLKSGRSGNIPQNDFYDFTGLIWTSEK